jgi:hypothetical protein
MEDIYFMTLPRVEIPPSPPTLRLRLHLLRPYHRRRLRQRREGVERRTLPSHLSHLLMPTQSRRRSRGLLPRF